MDKYTMQKAVKDGIREAERGPIFEPTYLLYFIISMPSLGVAIIAISHQSWIAYIVGIVAIWFTYMHTKPLVHTVLASLIGAYVTYIFIDFINEGSVSFWQAAPIMLLMFTIFFLNGIYMRWRRER